MWNSWLMTKQNVKNYEKKRKKKKKKNTLKDPNYEVKLLNENCTDTVGAFV